MSLSTKPLSSGSSKPDVKEPGNRQEASQDELAQVSPVLRHLSRHLVRQLGMLSGACGQLPLTPVQAHTLLELGQQDLSIKELSSLLNIDKSNASRAVSHLVKKQLAQTKANPRDNRCLQVSLTPAGHKMLKQLDNQQDNQFADILAQLAPSEVTQLEASLRCYNKAITKAKSQQGVVIRPLQVADDAGLAAVIRAVSAEYGLTPDKGYSVADPTLDHLSRQYGQPGSRYWVIEKQQQLLGGAGIAPLPGENGVCELQKMYFMPALRGLGLSRRLALQCLSFAREQGYKACYLETTKLLPEALGLYASLGFTVLPKPLGNTGHSACEIPMLLTL
ncbi:MAG: bifunctional helix-turn-helix transcriptional regulator/GNAT family N-acetyltransferase [Shewanella algae]